MARPITLFFSVLTLLLSLQFVVCIDPPEISPVPSPDSGATPPSPLSSPPNAGSPAPNSPSSSPEFGSPPAPPSADLPPGSSPTPSPSDSPAPAPAPANATGMNHSGVSGDVAEEKEGSSGGLRGKQKAGVALGVIAAACVVVVGGVVYKKRQDNIRRSQYGYAARRELL